MGTYRQINEGDKCMAVNIELRPKEDIPTNLFDLLKKDLLHGNDTCYIKKIEIERHFDHPFLPGSDPDGYEITVDFKNVVTGNISHARCIVSDSAIVNCDCREQHVARELDLKIFKED